MTWQLSFKNYSAYHRLMRMDKPIGIYLLLWPTCWALWIASEGLPDLFILTIFTLGVITMRAAGCVINDYADRDFDGHVKRTNMRPIATGEVTPKEALQLFMVLILFAFILVLTLGLPTILLSFGALLLASCYPFVKRISHYPQVVLGAAFSWSIPMAYMAIQGSLPLELWILYLANLTWTVAYDTYYAMVDRDDDLKIGVKSTAIAFGRYDLLIIALLKAVTIGCFVALFALKQWHLPMIVAITLASLLFLWQLFTTKSRGRDECFAAFLQNHYVGLVLFIGLILEYALF